MDMEDILEEVLISELSEKIDIEILKRALSEPVKKKIYRKLTEEIFYSLLKDKKISLVCGYGTIIVKSPGEREKQVFDKKVGSMVTKKIKSSRIVYNPGEVVKQFL
jgi:hypothetical protein